MGYAMEIYDIIDGSRMQTYIDPENPRLIFTRTISTSHFGSFERTEELHVNNRIPKEVFDAINNKQCEDEKDAR